MKNLLTSFVGRAALSFTVAGRRAPSRSIHIAVLGLLAAAGTASATVTTLNGNAADYHITLPEGNGAINAQAGIGSPGRLGTFRETRNPPSGRIEGERRAIFEFDLASLQPLGPTITSANFSLFLPSQASAVPTHDADLWGSTSNRSSLKNFDSVGATDEFADASYQLIAPKIFENVIPPSYNQRYGKDITAFLQARYTDFLSNNANRYVFFRLQVEPNVAVVNSFYEIVSGDGVAAQVPMIEVNVIPAPSAAALLGVAGLLAARRRR